MQQLRKTWRTRSFPLILFQMTLRWYLVIWLM
jgi:hypothetical protein